MIVDQGICRRHEITRNIMLDNLSLQSARCFTSSLSPKGRCHPSQDKRHAGTHQFLHVAARSFRFVSRMASVAALWLAGNGSFSTLDALPLHYIELTPSSDISKCLAQLVIIENPPVLSCKSCELCSKLARFTCIGQSLQSLWMVLGTMFQRKKH